MRLNVKEYLSTVTIVLLIGGHAGRLLPFLKSLYHDLIYVLRIDCPEEIKRSGNSRQAVGVQTFELGVNHSAQTLCDEAPYELQQHLRAQGGMDASSGMGGVIAVGYHAGKRLVESAQLKAFIRRTLIPEIHAVTGGAAEAIRIVSSGSFAGGTYSGAESPIVDGVTEQLLTLTSGTVTTHSLATGGLTYEKVAHDPWLNTAAAMMEQVRRCTDPCRSPREIRRLRLIEFPVLGQDEPLRDAYLAQVEQASLSEFMRLDQQRRSPNEALSGAFGNIQSWEAAFGNKLDVAGDIAAVAYIAYGDRLRECIEHGSDPTVVDRIKVSHDQVRLNNEAVETIVIESVDHSVQWAISKLQVPTHRHAVRVHALISANELIDLKTYESLWASLPTTPDELSQRIQLQNRLIVLLSDLYQELEVRKEEIEVAQDAAIGRFAKCHQSLISRGFFGLLSSVISSGAKKFARLNSAGFDSRDLSDELVAINAERAAVEEALKFVQESHSHLIKRTEKCLECFEKAGAPLGNRPATVELHPLDGRLVELFAVSDEGQSSFLDWLRCSVRHATVFGLAKVCGADAPAIEEIARQIVYNRAYSTPAVPWGGRRRADRGHCVHILPPLDDKVKELVVEAVRRLNSDTLIAVADKAPVVVNVVRIEMRVVQELDDILTNPYKLGLTEAVNSPCPLRYFPRGLEPLRRFGIYDFKTSATKENQ